MTKLVLAHLNVSAVHAPIQKIPLGGGVLKPYPFSHQPILHIAVWTSLEGVWICICINCLIKERILEVIVHR